MCVCVCVCVCACPYISLYAYQPLCLRTSGPVVSRLPSLPTGISISLPLSDPLTEAEREKSLSPGGAGKMGAAVVRLFCSVVRLFLTITHYLLCFDDTMPNYSRANV